jgi:hypothetical protein
VVHQIATHGKSPDLVREVAGFVKTLVDAIRA